MASNRVPPVGGTTASTSSAGIVQLTDSTSSTSTTTAATPNSVKSSYDLANGAIAKTLTTTTGDIIYASSANTPARLGIGSTGQVLTVSGGIPAWGGVSSPTAQGVALENSINLTLTSGVYTTLTWNNEAFDTDGFHSTVTNTNRITIPTGLGGKYMFYFIGYVNPSATGDFVAKFQLNGNDCNRWVHKIISGEPFSPVLSEVFSLNANDYVQVLCYQATGYNQDISIAQYGQFAAFRIGA